MDIMKTPARVLGALTLTLALGACDFISPVDTDPNAVPNANEDQLFTGIQVSTFFFTESQVARIAAIYTQQMSGTDRQFTAIDRYQRTEEDADDTFSAIYTGGGLVDLRNAISQAEESGRNALAGILKIHEAYMFGMAASVWGAIPYSEAATPEVDAPTLDPQAEVYGTVQALLDEAIADLASPEPGLPVGALDLNFAGNPAAWTAVANTLKARLYMHWGEVDGAAAYTAARDAALAGITTPAGNWTTIHSEAATENNLWYQFMRDRAGYISSGDFLVPLMAADADPRLPFYFNEVAGGGYVARTSDLSITGYGSPAFDIPILTCAENAFIMAEAEYQLGNEPAAIAAAQAGVACQATRWGVDLTAQSAAFAGLTGAALLSEIMTQKYIALFLNMEAWNDYKRTCLPAIIERAGGMPGRQFYGQQERQTNPNIPQPSQQPVRNANDPNPC